MLLTGGYLVAFKRYFADIPALLYLGLVEGAALCWYIAIGWAIGRGLPAVGSLGLDWTAVLILLGVVIATVGSGVASVRALKSGDVSYVAPLSELAPPVVLGIELLVLGVQLTWPQVLGLIAVTAGVYVLNLGTGSLLTPLVTVVRRRPAQLALTSAGLIGVADVGKRVVLSQLAIPPQTLVAATFAGLTIGTLPLGLRRWNDRPRSGRSWVGLGGMALVLAAAEHLTALALTTTPASIISPILSGQALVAVIIGGSLLGENAVGRRVIATVLTAAGITIIAIA